MQSRQDGASNWITGPVVTFIDKDKDSVADECHACASSDDRRDQDLDGIPNGCDDCNVDLILTRANGLLSGTYRASQSITLGAGVQIPSDANVIFKSPLVKVSELVELPATSVVTIDPSGCIE